MRYLLAFALCTFALAPVVRGADAWKGAHWIWDKPDSQDQAPRYLRHSFELKGEPAEARAWVVVDDRHVCYVNGQKVGERNEWQNAGEYDVRAHLKEGKNVIAVEGVNNGAQGGAIVWVEVKSPDGATQTVASGKGWKISTDKSDGWLTPDFDDGKWPTAVVLGPAWMEPWNLLGGNHSGAGLVDKYQSADEEKAQFLVPENFKIELVAAEPLLINPVSLALDEKGRMFVGESHTYRYGPDGSPVKPYTNPIVMLDPLPDGKGYQRVVVAEGFDDPCMGLLVKDNKLWATSNQWLYLFDLGPDGKATNKRVLLEDKNKAWNPFGFFMIEWGPDGLLYLSVGDHEIKIDGPTNKAFGARGRSGMVCRMKPDGSDLELLTQGFRVPYAFEFDPFGQLWLLSNGEGNPNRYAKIIKGADYFCFTREGADHDWLGAEHPLAPPVIERPRGAATALLHYYGGAFPESMQGDQFLINWGPHGFGKINHTLDRYVPDDRGNVSGEPQQWLGCDDPHFRPTTVLVGPDGNLLIADWYGRDDESDVTGRIWKLSYAGSDAPGAYWKGVFAPGFNAATDVDKLSMSSHLVREKAIEALVTQGGDAVAGLSTAVKGAHPLGAASALWALARIGTPEALAAAAQGGSHRDWRVRRLAAQLAARYRSPEAIRLSDQLANDPDPAVRVAAALAHTSPHHVRAGMTAALPAGAAADRHLRYEAALHVARTALPETFGELLKSVDENVRLAGLIALDVALYEKLPTAPLAVDAIAAVLSEPGQLDTALLIDLALMGSLPPDQRERFVGPVQKLLAGGTLKPAAIAKGVLLLRGLSTHAELGNLAKTALEAIARGEVQIRTGEDMLAVFELLSPEKPTEWGVRFIERGVREGNEAVRSQAHALAVKYGAETPGLVGTLWKHLRDRGAAWDQRMDIAATLAAIEPEPDRKAWQELLNDCDPMLARDLVRSWRRFQGNPDQGRFLLGTAPALVAKDPAIKEDLATVLAALGVAASDLTATGLTAAASEESNRVEDVLKRPADDNNRRLGRSAFARAGCVQCHSAGNDARLGPPLAGIGATQTREYLLESILEPSKIIKTGFETEVIDAGGGKVYSGLVRPDGEHLRIVTATGEDLVPLAQVKQRRVQKLSIMPEDLEKAMSPGELADVLAYLQSLKTTPTAAR